MELSDRFKLFAQYEARGSSDLYERLTSAAAEDEELLALLRPLSERQHQPNLLMGVVNYLGGISESYASFRTFVFDNWDEIRELLATKRTQTNEVGRCATLLPAIASVEGPLALLEVGTSAGLNLFIDRYAYDYGEAGRVGDSALVLRCEARGAVPIPSELPEVVFRKGIDIAPVDVTDDDALRWLEACIWPDQTERLERFRTAVSVVREDPPEIAEGDLVDGIEAVLDEVPSGATAVVYHTAVLGYLREERREAFAEIMRRRDVVWFSNEGPGVVPSVRWTTTPPPGELCFFLGRGGRDVVAYTHPHGRWVQWV